MIDRHMEPMAVGCSVLVSSLFIVHLPKNRYAPVPYFITSGLIVPVPRYIKPTNPRPIV